MELHLSLAAPGRLCGRGVSRSSACGCGRGCGRRWARRRRGIRWSRRGASAGVGCDRGLEVQRIGQVQVAVDLDPTVDIHVGQGDVEGPILAAAWCSALVRSGSNRALASRSAAQLGGPDLARERGDLGVDKRSVFRGQTERALGDQRQPPRRRAPLIRAGPSTREPVEALDRVGQERCRTRWSGPGPRRTRPPRTPRPPDIPRPPSGRPDSCDSSIGSTSDSAELIDAYCAAARMTCRAASSSTCFSPRAREHAGGVVCSPSSESGSKVEVIVRLRLPPTTDSASGSGSLVDKGSGTSAVNGKWIGRRHALSRPPGASQRELAVVSTSSIRGGIRRRRVRSQPTGGNTIGSCLALAGAVPPPREPEPRYPLDAR